MQGEGMGYDNIIKRVIKCILDGEVEHQSREGEADKNIYMTGEMSDNDMLNLFKCCKGNRYKCEILHGTTSEVHIMKSVGKYDGYYIKFYFNEDTKRAVFISVHE
jgi:hypothetical protein